MQIRKTRWSNVYESAEEELVALLARKNIQAQRWAAEEGEEIPEKQTAADTQLWCAEGQLTCTAGGRAYSLQPGDVIDIPAQTSYVLQPGFGGCACYESSVRN